MDSILTSIKKLLGITEEYDHFDQDIIMHINSVFMILQQIGIGPEEGFSISNKDAVWSDYISDSNKVEAVKSYVFLKVRMLFDPPASSVVMESMNRMTSELEWRLSMAAETNKEVIQNE